MTGGGFRTIALALLSMLAACAAEPRCEAPAAPRGLERFYGALADLKSGKRTRPVSILHLGDSHISLDHMTGVLRAHWAAEFGDAGRGLPPGIPYRYYDPEGYAVSMSGPWQVASSGGRDAAGPFGIQGFRISASDPLAEMTVETGHPIREIEIETVGEPKSGAVEVAIDGAAPLRLATAARKQGLVVLRVPAADAHRVALRPAGDGPATLLGWAMLSGRPGVRYDSFGIVGVRADVTERWDREIVAQQIATLAPDLVILEYGTNEGFVDRIDARAYATEYGALIRKLQTLAPHASIAVLGAFDGARRASPGERASCGDGWTTPPMLDVLREVQREAARSAGAFFFDTSRIMGRPCGIDHWARTNPPLAWPDCVHLRPDGARRMGEAIWQALMTDDRRACAAH
jgi:lysophospholipase L1-like esterase